MSYVQAEWYDALSLDYWAAARPALREILEPWRGTRGVSVDLGAGTGLASELLAELTAGEVLACEPDDGQRVGLMTRVCARPELRDRVTVLPWDAHTLSRCFAEPVEVVALLAVLDHLNRAERAELLGWAAAQLSPTGAMVVGPFAGVDPGVATLTGEHADPRLGDRYVNTRVGRRRYEGWARSTPCGDVDEFTVEWCMTWRMCEGERVLEERQAQWRVTPITAEAFAAEAAEAGLRAEQRDAFVILTRPADQ